MTAQDEELAEEDLDSEELEKEQPEQEPYDDEFDEVKERKQRHMPKIYSYANENQQKLYGAPRLRPTLSKVINTPQFMIHDLHIQDSEEEHIIGTFALFYIKPGGQVLPLGIPADPDLKKGKTKNLWYEVLSGKGLLCIADYTEKIIQCDLILIESEVKHNFINTGQHPLLIKLLYDSYLDLRDRYTPTAHIVKEAEESKQKLFNVQKQAYVEHEPQAQGQKPPSPQQPSQKIQQPNKVTRVPVRTEGPPETKQSDSDKSKTKTPGRLKSEDRFV